LVFSSFFLFLKGLLSKEAAFLSFKGSSSGLFFDQPDDLIIVRELAGLML
jgi:hypothetical protein